MWAASRQNLQYGMCAQRRLRSAWASAQSDQSLRCPHEETLSPLLPIELIAKTLIRLGIRPVWSESSLGAHWSFCWFCHVAAHVSKSLKHVLSPLLGRRDLVCVLLVHLFVCFVRVSFCLFLFLLVSGAGCGLWLWHSLDFSINCFER